MLYLLIAALLWSLAFGPIKMFMTNVPPLFLGSARAFIAFLCFLPFFFKTFKKLNYKEALSLLFVGLMEYGVPYALYLQSYQYLKAYQIALFLTFTPFYVTLLNDLLKKRFLYKNFMAALLAIFGASLINFGHGDFQNTMKGFLLLQLADFGFAFGQIYYKRIYQEGTKVKKEGEKIPWVILGGLIPLALLHLASSEQFSIQSLNQIQWWVLLYLGIGSTGLAYYFFNKGIGKVSGGVLAVMNNLKVPLAVFWSIFIFKESLNTSLINFSVGSSMIILALYIAIKNQHIEKA